MNKGISWFNLTMLLFGFVFLYAPIALLILFSFNSGRLVTVWSGFSTRWYGELLRNEQILDAALVSLQIGAINATVATILGTLTAFAMNRFGNFRGRTLFTGISTAPLVMPDVITGLAMLLYSLDSVGRAECPPSPSHTSPSPWPLSPS
jgi:putrescine transport system permease protein